MAMCRWMMSAVLSAGMMMSVQVATAGQGRSPQPAEGEFLSGSSSSSGRLLPGMPAFAAVQDFLRRMGNAFPATQPNAAGFVWPEPSYLDVQSVGFAASREEMAHSLAGDFGRFLASDAKHRTRDQVVVASCSRPVIGGRTPNDLYSRRWEYRWQANAPKPGWQPERMDMKRVVSCPAPSATQ